MMPKKLWRSIGPPFLWADYLQQTEEKYNWCHWYPLRFFPLASMSLLFYECCLIDIAAGLAQLLYYFFHLLFPHVQKEQQWTFFVLTDHRKFFVQLTMNPYGKYFLAYLTVPG